ncbi:MAG: aminotransferase DegT [Candidatus Methanomethylicota archaeon]|uniref:Aminotransferase DegT n=1 Tax=Thermoproteota archaeon TaxID=2056631 RepID=A0A497ELM3_9CREN|nr:MAG: aminotransferase DegT [Candidatus Verstraetearchaeota archaeon]
MAKRIPIAKPIISKREIDAVTRVLKSGLLVAGEKVKEFQKRFAKYLGAKYAIATSNGTTALHAALWGLDISEGDEVITTSFSFVASSNAILFVGGKPVFVDIDPKTFNIDPEKIEDKITDRTKALLIVHLYGQPCDMKRIMKICREYGLLLIEDCAQAHGAEYKGRKVGTFGDVAIFSFYATKNMTTGEGGMVIAKKKSVAEKIRMIVDQGQKTKYNHVILGHNFRMTEIQAAIGVEQLKKLDEWNDKRIKNARFLTERLRDIKEVKTPFVLSGVKHVYHQYVIKCKRRNQLRKYLSKMGIETAIHYPKPIYRQPLYQKLGYKNLRLKEVERVVREVLSLPIHPSVTRKDLEFIADGIKKFMKN